MDKQKCEGLKPHYDADCFHLHHYLVDLRCSTQPLACHFSEWIYLHPQHIVDLLQTNVQRALVERPSNFYYFTAKALRRKVVLPGAQHLHDFEGRNKPNHLICHQGTRTLSFDVERAYVA